MPTPEAVCQWIIELRRRRWTGAQIASTAAVSPATVSRVLRRAGLSRLGLIGNNLLSLHN